MTPDDSEMSANPPPELMSVHPQEEFRTTSRLRLAAEKAFLDWNNSQRLQRAANSRHRRLHKFSAGDLVFIWRRQVTGKDAYTL